MSLVADELEAMVIEALPGSQEENNDYLRELVGRLEAHIVD